MPFDLIAVPVLACLLLGVLRGLKAAGPRPGDPAAPDRIR